VLHGRGGASLEREEWRSTARWMLRIAGCGLRVWYVLHEIQMSSAKSPVSRSEAATLAELRTVLSAEMAYAADNDGAFCELECLLDRASCGAPVGTGPYVLERKRNGYVRRFIPGDPVTGAKRRRSINTFVFVAEPEYSLVTGVRSFAIEQTGRLCGTEIRESQVALLAPDGTISEHCKDRP